MRDPRSRTRKTPPSRSPRSRPPSPTSPADSLAAIAASTLAGRVLRMIGGMSEREPPELGPRKSAVLRAVVEQYVQAGEPVSSESIAEHARLGVSSAPIRQEMAALGGRCSL